MLFIVCIGFILCITFALSCLSERRMEETAAPAAFFIIIILYISGLCQNLLIGEYVIIGLSAASALFLVYRILIRRDWGKLKYILTPGLLAFLVFLAFNAVISRGRWLSEWDEFSHWGHVTLSMYRWDKLGNCPGTTLLFPGYPPAASIWEYFFVCLKGTFSEAYLFAANNMLAFILLLPIFKKTAWRQWKNIFVFLAVIILMPLFFFTGFWSTIYVDGLLGVWMTYILYSHFSEREETPYKTMQICLALGLYPLVKAAGTGLAFLAVSIIFVDILAGAGKKAGCKRKLFPIAVYIASIFAGKESWSCYLKLFGTVSAWDSSGISIKRVLTLLSGRGEDYQYQTIRNFAKAFFEGKGGETITVFGFLLLITVCTILVYRFGIWNRRQLILYTGSFFFCVLAYAASLLFLYCFSFSVYESTNLASYERYMNSIMLGLFGFLVCMLISANVGSLEKYILVILLFLMIPINSVKAYTVDLNDIKQTKAKERKKYENMEEFADFMDWEKDKVYLIEQKSHGFSTVVGRYNATPVRLGGAASLGTPYYDGDVWTQNYTLQEWEEELRQGGYSYVYILYRDEQFMENYCGLFEDPAQIKNRALYQVEETEEGIRLVLYKEY